MKIFLTHSHFFYSYYSFQLLSLGRRFFFFLSLLSSSFVIAVATARFTNIFTAVNYTNILSSSLLSAKFLTKLSRFHTNTHTYTHTQSRSYNNHFDTPLLLLLLLFLRQTKFKGFFFRKIVHWEINWTWKMKQQHFHNELKCIPRAMLRIRNWKMKTKMKKKQRKRTHHAINSWNMNIAHNK